MVKFNKTNLNQVLTAKPHVFEDCRGEYLEIYNKELYQKNLFNMDFVEDDISVSYKHVLRGIHGNDTTYKLVSCLVGRFYLVVVNNDPKSNEYKKWQSFMLSDKNRLQVLIPPKFGNGHLVLSDYAIFHYKQSEYYDKDSQFTIRWNDPVFNIWWPIDNPILSKRDEDA